MMVKCLHKLIYFLFGAGLIYVCCDHYLSDPIYFNIVSVVAFVIWVTIFNCHIDNYFAIKERRQLKEKQ